MRVIGLIVGLGLVAGACGGGRPQPASIAVGADRVPTTELVDAAAGLCLATSQAASDPSAARATFFDRSHQTIHTIARALETADRAMAARLLEAKQAVEADFTAGTSPPKLQDDLARLADTTRMALDRLNVGVRPCS